MSLWHVFTWLNLGLQLSSYYIWYRLLCWDLRLFYRHSLRLLRDKNILFTKIFQSLSDNGRIDMSPELRGELRCYNANVSYTEDEIDYDTIDAVEAEYGVRVNRHVVNSGMIALIFHCTQADSEEPNAILKLKRRQITEHLREGCASVAFLYGLAAYWCPRNIYIRVLRPFINNLDDIIEQCNFDHEIRNTREAKEDYADLDFIKIPTIYNREDATENAFILMERIRGTHTLPVETPEEDRIRYFQQLSIFTAFSIISNAMYHTDLHAGNILFMPTGIGIIDFGMALRLSNESHDILLTIADITRGEESIDNIDPCETFRYLFDPVLRVQDITDVPRFRAICRQIVNPLAEHAEVNELNLADQLEELSASLNQEIALNQDFYKIVLSVTMTHIEVLILGNNYYDQARVHQISKSSIQTAYLMIM
jgi:tRNA A-37 threonylcarbamoyl transferase component Bud32